MATSVASAQTVTNAPDFLADNAIPVQGSVDFHVPPNQFFGVNELSIDGDRFIGFHPALLSSANGAGIQNEIFSVPITLVPGDSYAFITHFQVGEITPGGTWPVNNGGNNPGFVEIYAGTAPGDQDTLIHRTATDPGDTDPAVPPALSEWNEELITFTNTGNWTHLTFVALGPAGGATPYILIDGLTLAPSADLQTTKTLASGNSAPNVGDTVSYTITVTNNGPDAATNVSLTDQLPAGLTPTGNNGNVSTGSYAAGSGVWAIPSLANGTIATLTLEGTVDAGQGGQTITNTTTAATSPDQVDLVSSGDDLTEVITVGPEFAVSTGPQTCPADFINVIGNPNFDNGFAEWTQSGTPLNLNSYTSIPSGVAYTNVANLSFNGVSGSLSQTIAAGLVGGENLTFDFGWNNGSPGTAAIVTVSVAGTDILQVDTTDANDNVSPAEVTFLNGASGTIGGVAFASGVPGDLPISIFNAWDLFTVNAVLPAGLSNSGVLAVNYSLGVDDFAIDNFTLCIPEAADLQTVKTLAAGSSVTPEIGEPIQYEITVTNNGPLDATNVTLSDPIPAGVTGLSTTVGTATVGTYDVSTGLWDIGTLTNGQSAVLTLDVAPNGTVTGQTITNVTTAATSADVADPTTTGDDLTADITIAPLAPVTLVPAPVCDINTAFTTFDATPVDGTLGPHVSTAPNGETVTVTSIPPTVGGFTTGRPIYQETETNGETMLSLVRGGGTGAVTVFEFSTPRDDLRMSIRDILTSREQTEIVGFNGATPVFPSFISLTDGAVVFGPNQNFVQDSDLVAQAGAEFTFTTPVDRVEVRSTANSLQDFIFIDLFGCVGADLVTTKTLAAGSSATPNVGDTVSYEITVANNGTLDATNVTLTDILPAGLTATGNNGIVTAGTYTSGTGVWDIPSLANGTSATLTLEGTVNFDQGGQTITNTLAVPASGDQDDPGTSGDNLTASVTVSIPPDTTIPPPDCGVPAGLTFYDLSFSSLDPVGVIQNDYRLANAGVINGQIVDLLVNFTPEPALAFGSNPLDAPVITGDNFMFNGGNDLIATYTIVATGTTTPVSGNFRIRFGDIDISETIAFDNTLFQAARTAVGTNLSFSTIGNTTTITGASGPRTNDPLDLVEFVVVGRSDFSLNFNPVQSHSGPGYTLDGNLDENISPGVCQLTSSGELAGAKTVDMFDPDGLGLFAVPGNDVIYTITVSNTGAGPIDDDSIFLVDALPEEVEFIFGEANGPGSGTDPVIFTDIVPSGLDTFNFANDVAFSDAPTAPTSFDQCTYTPTVGFGSPDPAITFICFNPKGVMGSGDPDPSFSFSFRARIR